VDLIFKNCSLYRWECSHWGLWKRTCIYW